MNQVDTKEGTKGVGRVFARDDRVRIAHYGLPNLYGPTPLENIDPHRALVERLGVISKQIIQCIWVGFRVKLHLTLFHNLKTGFKNFWLDIKPLVECVILDNCNGASDFSRTSRHGGHRGGVWRSKRIGVKLRHVCGLEEGKKIEGRLAREKVKVNRGPVGKKRKGRGQEYSQE